MRARPPSESRFHGAFTSSVVLQATRKDTEGLNLNNGPALIAAKGCPERTKFTRSAARRFQTIVVPTGSDPARG